MGKAILNKKVGGKCELITSYTNNSLTITADEKAIYHITFMAALANSFGPSISSVTLNGTALASSQYYYVSKSTDTTSGVSSYCMWFEISRELNKNDVIVINGNYLNYRVAYPRVWKYK